MLEAREEEKARIARELHDELGQLLTALKMDLGWLRERLLDAELAPSAGEDGRAARPGTVSSTRRISADLRPLMLDDLGLGRAAAWLVEDFAKRCASPAASRSPAEELQDFSKAVGTAVYRAIQESLTNIARHAGAKNAWVMLGAETAATRGRGRGRRPRHRTRGPRQGALGA